MRKYTILLSLFTFVASTSESSAQSFTEICSTSNMNGTMVNCAFNNDTLYATGFFTEVCGNTTSYVAKWNGTTWGSTNVPLSNAGHVLEFINDELYIGTYVDAVDSNWLYHFDGANLNKLGEGVYLTTATGFSELPNIYDVIEFNGQIYVCGEFDRVGNQSVSGIMRWNGMMWEDVGGGLSGNIQGSSPLMYPHQMAIHNNELCVVGNFRFAGGIEVNGVAKWNGTSWSALSSGFNSTVYGVGVYNGELFVGGDFTQSGSQTLKRIAKWDGSNWVSPGFGFESPSPMDYTFVHTFYEANGGVYISGGIQEIELDAGGSLNCGGIIHFSQAGINTFNGGVVGNDIEAIGESVNGDILIGGGVFGNGYVGVLDSTAEVNDISNSPLRVFPNPMSNVLNLDLSNEITALQLLDGTGRIIETILLNEKSIDVTNLERGMYTLHYQTKNSNGAIIVVK